MGYAALAKFCREICACGTLQLANLGIVNCLELLKSWTLLALAPQICAFGPFGHVLCVGQLLGIVTLMTLIDAGKA